MVTTTVNLPDEDVEEAKRRGINISETCRRAIKAELKSMEFIPASNMPKRAVIMDATIDNKLLKKMQAIIKTAYLGCGSKTKVQITEFRKAVKMATGVYTDSAVSRYIETLVEFGFVTADSDYIFLTEKTCRELGAVAETANAARDEVDAFTEQLYMAKKNDTDQV